MVLCSCLEKGRGDQKQKSKNVEGKDCQPSLQDPPQTRAWASVPVLVRPHSDSKLPPATPAPFSCFPQFWSPCFPGGPQPAPRVPTGPTLPSMLTCFWTGSPRSSSTSLVTSRRMLQGSLLRTWWAFYHPPGVILGTEGQMSWPCSEPAGQL